MLLKTKERQTTLSEDISARVRVKVNKPEPDALRHIYGEPVQTDENGNEYFVIPSHKAQYTKEVFPRYIVSDEYLPEEEIDKLRDKSKNPKVEHKEKDEEIPVEHHQVFHHESKKRGNPNWGKKKEVVIDKDDDTEPPVCVL